MRKTITSVYLTLMRYLNAASIPHELQGTGSIVLDNGTFLQWVKDPSQFGTKNWDDACAFVKNLVFGGYADWRLPSGLDPDGTLCNSAPHGANCPNTELGHLYFSHYLADPPGDMSPFENFENKLYWTATEFPDDPTKAMSQDFNDGGNNPWNKSGQLSVWPVRKDESRWMYFPFLGWRLVWSITIPTFAAVAWWVLRRRRKNI